MNKSHVHILALLLLCCAQAFSQEKKTIVADGLYYSPQPEQIHHGISHVSYFKEHLYYHLGDELNVIDIDVEWPDKVDGSLVRPLQHFLAEKIFKVDADTLTDAYTKMKARYGEPVREKFKTLPDDRKYCHVSYELKEMGYEPSKYVSYILTSISEPKELSSQKGDTTIMLLTYDLGRQTVLTIDDIIRRSRLESSNYRRPFLRMLINGVGEEVEGNYNAIQVIDGCISGEDILFKTLWTGDKDPVSDVSAIPWNWLKDYLDKNLYKQLRRPAAAIADEPYILPKEKDGRPIYVAVDQNAEYPGGHEAMMKYVSSTIVISDDARPKKKPIRCIATFIVDENGRISDVAVISKANPEIDRAVVTAIKSMPLWKPAQVDGKAVKQRLSIPIQFQPER